MLFADLRCQKIATIASIQQQIEDLQELLSQEQAHLQAIGSVEQSAESALTQVSNAIRGIEAICPSELALFKDQILALFDDRGTLPPDDAPDSPSPDSPPETTIDIPTNSIDTTDSPIDIPANPIVTIPDNNNNTTIDSPIDTIPDNNNNTTIGDTPPALPTTIDVPTPKRRGRKPKAPPLAA